MANWLNVNPTSGTAGETTTVRLTPVNENTGRLDRTGLLKIKSGESLLKQIPVTQTAKELFIDIVNNEFTVVNTGGIISLDLTTNAYGISMSWNAYQLGDNVPPYVFTSDVSNFDFLGKIEGLYFDLPYEATEKSSYIKIYNKILGCGLKKAKEMIDNGNTCIFFFCDSSKAPALSSSITSIITDIYPSYGALTLTIYTTEQIQSMTANTISSELGRNSSYRIYIPDIVITQPYDSVNSSVIEISGKGEDTESCVERLTVTHRPPEISTSVDNIIMSENEASTLNITVEDADWVIDTSEQTQI